MPAELGRLCSIRAPQQLRATRRFATGAPRVGTGQYASIAAGGCDDPRRRSQGVTDSGALRRRRRAESRCPQAPRTGSGSARS